MSATTELTAFEADRSFPPDLVIFGRSGAMNTLREQMAKVAPENVPVLLEGENGTGKEILARLVHNWSRRRDHSFVKITCPAIPEDLLESELYGYEAGAFTGASVRKLGRVESAHNGTLLFDGIPELDPRLQVKLLHLLQDGRFVRIGGDEELRVDVRWVCSSSYPIETRIESGAFREDLYYRISVVHLRVPPLRERREDIPFLAAWMVDHYSRKFDVQRLPVSSDLLNLFQAYSWPGNIRELENLIQRYVVLGSEDLVSSELLAQTPRPAQDAPLGTIPLKQLTRQVRREQERRIILEALHTRHWNRKQTARALGISYRTLLSKMQEDGLAGITRQRTPIAPTACDSEAGG
ncbi:MAG: sigma 54-interacting transcriptional regulator [Terriglobia bacterium]